MILIVLNKRPFYLKSVVAVSYLLLICVAVIWLVLQWQIAPRIETSMTSLLPHKEGVTVFQALAQNKMDQRLNRNMLALVSHEEPQQLTNLASELQRLWEQSDVFAFVSGNINPDLEALQQQIAPLQLMAPTTEQWQALQKDPQSVFNQQAQRLINPFVERGPLPVQEDWLGLADLVRQNAAQDSPVFWDLQSSWLTVQNGDKTWLLLRGQLLEQAGLINIPDGFLSLIEWSQQVVAEADGELLIAGGAIFGAENKASGESESWIMSTVSLLITALLLLWVFRSSRIFAVIVPLSCGILMGLVATIAVFGEIHILTLVVGSSLIGILIDFPLHWLASGVVQSPWLRWTALRVASKAFLLSLVITLMGYVALLITPLPILQQSAVFSIAALVSAFLATLFVLPFFFVTWEIKTSKGLVAVLRALAGLVHAIKKAILQRRWSQVLIVLFILGALLRLSTQDDIRQWAYLSPTWLEQAKKVAEITEVEPSGQYLLVIADNNETLLASLDGVTKALTELQERGEISQFQSINQWVVSVEEQQARQSFLRKLQLDNTSWSALTTLGITDEILRDYLHSLSQLPILSIEESLQPEIAEAWQDLYLTAPQIGKVASIVTLNAIHDVSILNGILNAYPNVTFVDQRSELNTLFAETRNLAIVLKIISYALAILLLARLFGWKRGFILLMVPVIGSILSMVVFALMGWTLSLFAIFGLFLVTAIGMDYAIYVSMSHISINERLAGVTLAALTTMVSFGVLGFSETPALAGFSRSVVFGVLFSVLLAISLLSFDKLNKE